MEQWYSVTLATVSLPNFLNIFFLLSGLVHCIYITRTQQQNNSRILVDAFAFALICDGWGVVSVESVLSTIHASLYCIHNYDITKLAG